MTKLFSKEDFKDIEVGKVVRYEEDTDEVQNEIEQLSQESYKLSTSYIQVLALKENIEENNSFVTESNYKEINKYIESICMNLNYSYENLKIGLESKDRDLSLSMNVIAMEGFLANIWAKIKALFAKIYEKIKEFFKRYFTRFGRIKGKLTNIQEVLKELDSKGLKVNMIDEAPSGLINKFGIETIISFNLIETLVTNTFSINNELISIISKLDPLSKTPIISTEKVEELKKLKSELEKNKTLNEDFKTTKAQIADSKIKELGITTISKAKELLTGTPTKKGQTLSDLKEDIKNTEEKIETDEKAIKDTEGKLSSVKKEYTEEDKNDELNKYMNEVVKQIHTIGDKIKDAIIINCKKIKLKDKVEESDPDIIEFEELNKEGTASLMIGTKEQLLKIVNLSVNHIKEIENISNKLLSIQDNLFKNIDNVDRIIKTLDAEDKEGNFKNYKSYVDNSIRPKLLMFKNIVLTTSKMINSFKSSELDACEGVIEYSVTSMKYFA